MRFFILPLLFLLSAVAAADMEALVSPIGVEVSVPGAEPVDGVPDAPPIPEPEARASRLPLWVALGATFALADIALVQWILKRRRTAPTE